MSTSTSACYGFKAQRPRKSSRKRASHHLFGSVAVAGLVVGCAWTVYANVFAGSVYPSLSSANFDAPVIRRPSTFAERNPFAVANNTVVVESAPRPSAAVTVTPGPSLSFEDRFAAAAAQGVAPAPAPQMAAQPTPNRQVAVLAPPPERQVADSVAKPSSHLAEARPKGSGASVRDMAQRAKAAVMAAVTPPPAPPEKPTIFERLFGKLQSSGSTLAYASADVGSTSSLGPTQNPALGGNMPLYDRTTAVYDISAHTVYLPDGTKLEAHSGLGDRLDDPRSANVRMRGVTPPHLYDLKPREALFHGVPALRLNPIGGEEAIYGRAGLLAHTYMLGPNGDSNGCVSFKNYEAFLRAYRNGEVKRLAVVARLD
jgi:type VI secretion system (T6SS) effector TldE1-like protein